MNDSARTIERERLLAAYDAQLRGDGEISGGIRLDRLGPLRLVTLSEGRGFITYPRPSAEDGESLGRLVPQALEYFASDPAIAQVEWKTRAHDSAPGLHEALVASDFVPADPESIMLGRAEGLAVDLPLPDGVILRRLTEESDVRAMSAMQDEIFGDPVSVERADAILRRLANRDGTELWIAEAGGQIVSAGRLEPVPGSDFASIWGGATRPEWRGRGIYRALTAARARSALAVGKTLIHSDSTEFSRPILEKSGLLAVSTTTPYEWERAR